MLNVKVNGIAVSVPKGSTILDAARAAGSIGGQMVKKMIESYENNLTTGMTK